MEILLQKGEMLILKGERRGLMIQCGEGMLWITQEGDYRDHLLKRCKNFTSSLPGRVVVTALCDSRLATGEISRVIGRNACFSPLSIAR
ncbi:MAG: DUF2917 domain-containing protein [Deltaproteobacteria bacterium]|nr:DUF2917 domain-containing protein [Deltaproteobacteria bacterium]